MRVLRKVMLGASVSALALVAASGVPAQAADSSSVNDSSSQGGGEVGTVDYFDIAPEFQEAHIGVSNAKNVFVSFDAINKKGEYNAKATWNLYETDEVVVDLSALKTTKDVYIAVKAGDSTPQVYHIAPITVKKNKGTYKPDSGKIDGVAADGTYEYRTAVGEWQPYGGSKKTDSSSVSGTTPDLSMYEQQGATLYFREAGNPFDEDGKNEEKDGFNQQNLKGGNFPSKEFKVKIPKRAKGPSVKIDYVKGVVTKPKNTVKIDKGDGKGFVDMASDETLKLSKTGGVIMIRTAATDKKPVSNPTVISYKLTTTADKNDITTTPKPDSKGKGKGTIELTNKNAKQAYVIYEKGKDRSGDKPIVTLKAGGKGKLSEDKIKGKDLVIAVASDKKTAAFQSDAVDFLSKTEIEAALSTATTAPSTVPDSSNKADSSNSTK